VQAANNSIPRGKKGGMAGPCLEKKFKERCGPCQQAPAAAVLWFERALSVLKMALSGASTKCVPCVRLVCCACLCLTLVSCARSAWPARRAVSAYTRTLQLLDDLVPFSLPDYVHLYGCRSADRLSLQVGQPARPACRVALLAQSTVRSVCLRSL
jgi:hypothetical protein